MKIIFHGAAQSILVHGESPASHALQAKLLENGLSPVFYPAPHEEADLD